MADKVKTTKREARRLIREHWAGYIETTDISANASIVGDPVIVSVWDDECRRIAARMRKAGSNG